MKKKLECPCGSQKQYLHCCKPLHEGSPALTAEALMRSRYCAYFFNLEYYLVKSWALETRPKSLDLQERSHQKWLSLEVIKSTLNEENEATVEFIARYTVRGKAHRHHELSRFRKEEGTWYYLKGKSLGSA